MPEELPSRHFAGEEYYNMRNAAKYIHKSYTGLRNLINHLTGTDDEIPVWELSGGSRERYIKKSDLDRYMRPRPVRAKE